MFWNWTRLVVKLSFSNVGVGLCWLGVAACVHVVSKIVKERSSE